MVFNMNLKDSILYSTESGRGNSKVQVRSVTNSLLNHKEKIRVMEDQLNTQLENLYTIPVENRFQSLVNDMGPDIQASTSSRINDCTVQSQEGSIKTNPHVTLNTESILQDTPHTPDSGSCHMSSLIQTGLDTASVQDHFTDKDLECIPE